MPTTALRRVCIIAGTLGQGGAERQLYYIAASLKAQGLDVQVICLTQGEFWEDKLRAAGIEVHFAGKHSSKLARLRDIAGLARKLKPQLLQSMHFYTNLYAWAAGLLTGIRAVGAFRNNLTSEIAANGFLGQLCFRFPRNTIANSHLAMKEAVRRGKPARRLFYLPNGVDTHTFSPKKKKFDPDGITLLTVGRLTLQKRTERFLWLIEQLLEQGHKVKGIVVGQGERYQLLRDQAVMRGMGNAVHFAGSQGNMAEWYRKADVFVLTSDYEGTPNVLLEAMACGLPVVSTAVGHVPYIVRPGGTGMTVGPGDDQALLDTVLQVISDNGLREALGQNARLFVEQECAIDKIGDNLMEIYGKVLG